MSKYTITESNEGSSLAALLNGELVAMDNRHPNFTATVEALRRGDDEAEIASLFNVTASVPKRLENLSYRVTVRNSNVYFDDVLETGPLAKAILRLLDEGGSDWEPLVKFIEKVKANPNEHSQQNLYRWLDAAAFTINSDGNIVGYKGIADDFMSSHSGHAFVNGEEVNGRVDNSPGHVISMPRDEVQHDPSRGCHTGLHVGVWDYASNFASRVVEVEVDPRDVVSVPTDCSDQKMRCCRYTVVKEIDRPYSEVIKQTYASNCNNCGEVLDFDGDCGNESCEDAWNYDGDDTNDNGVCYDCGGDLEAGGYCSFCCY